MMVETMKESTLKSTLKSRPSHDGVRLSEVSVTEVPMKEQPQDVLDVEKIRRDFPVLQKQVHGKPLAYLDNAATTLKPKVVADTVANHYLYGAANVHRGLHFLSEQATLAYEGTREKVRSFINAKEKAEVIFTSGTTAAINLMAHSFGEKFIHAGDEIVITHMEHHSNIVPWQLLCERKGALLKVAPISDAGEVLLDEFEALLTSKTKLVSFVGISNSLGTVNPIGPMIQMAHAKNIPVLVDGAQTLSHQSFDVQTLDCDFLVFSGHKLFGPTGVGVLYGKRKWLDQMPPFLGGGDMIRSVTFEKTQFAPLPYKFEAGTPNIAGVIGLGAAIDYIREIGIEKIAAYEQQLLVYGTKQLQEIPGLTLIGTAAEKTSILSFVLDDVHPHDLGSLLDDHGIAIRAGHHCTQPVMQRFKVPATARASLSFYNTFDELDRLVAALLKIKEMFR